MGLRTRCLAVALPALQIAACSDDGVQTQQDGAGTTAADDGASGISTTMTTAGSMTGPGATADEGTAGDSTGGEPSPGSTDDGPTPTTGSLGSTSDGGSTDGSGSSSSGTGDGSSGSSSGDGSSGSSSSGGFGDVPVGGECAADSECQSGVCWDFNDYDPFCFGTACSVTCVTDQDCIDAMTAAGAPTPQNATCGGDDRCYMLGTGFGAFACA